MTVAIAVLLAIGVASAWLGTLAALRLSPLGRLHALAFVNVAGGGPITLAACLHLGASAASAKVALIWGMVLIAGALSTHVSARAIHLRGGGRL